MRLTADVADALERGRPIVALESSVFAQGLPSPSNRVAWERMGAAIAAEGAVRAVTAVVRGTPSIGLKPADIELFLARTGIDKLSSRDLAVATVQGRSGATTVAGGIALARLAGIPVFATGGIGGVHRTSSSSSPVDESADLIELSRTSMVVVCSGAKAILDLPATYERLETLGIPVIGYRTDELPGFYTRTTGLSLSARAESGGEIAAALIAQRRLGQSSALLVVQPPPSETALDAGVIERAVVAALARADREGVRGRAVTPYLLAEVERETGGASLASNLALLESNARLAAEIAVALAGLSGGRHDAGNEDSRRGIELVRAGIVL
ncbi:MAG: pseudouridine-5'-phosphate glycosidase [Gemmatimonadaceae bacterium]